MKIFTVSLLSSLLLSARNLSFLIVEDDINSFSNQRQLSIPGFSFYSLIYTSCKYNTDVSYVFPCLIMYLTAPVMVQAVLTRGRAQSSHFPGKCASYTLLGQRSARLTLALASKMSSRLFIFSSWCIHQYMSVYSRILTLTCSPLINLLVSLLLWWNGN